MPRRRHHRDVEFSKWDFIQNIVGSYLYVLSIPGAIRADHQPVYGHEFSPSRKRSMVNVVSRPHQYHVAPAVVLLVSSPASGHKGLVINPLPAWWRTMRAANTVQLRRELICRWLSRVIYAANMNTAPVLTLAASQTIHHQSDAHQRHD